MKKHQRIQKRRQFLRVILALELLLGTWFNMGHGYLFYFIYQAISLNEKVIKVLFDDYKCKPLTTVTWGVLTGASWTTVWTFWRLQLKNVQFTANSSLLKYCHIYGNLILIEQWQNKRGTTYSRILLLCHPLLLPFLPVKTTTKSDWIKTPLLHPF